MLRVVTSLPVVKSLWADVEVMTSDLGILTTGIIVVEPIKLWLAFLDGSTSSLARCETPGTTPFIILIVTLYLSELAQTSVKFQIDLLPEIEGT